METNRMMRGGKSASEGKERTYADFAMWPAKSGKREREHSREITR